MKRTLRRGSRTARKSITASRTARDKYLKTNYGITEEEYKRLADLYNGGCWICRKQPKPGKNLACDHDHKIEKELKSVRRSLRGLLCFVCNRRLIGRRRREHAYLYANAAEYLESDAAQAILGELEGKG